MPGHHVSATPPSGTGAWGSGRAGDEGSAALRAWLYEVGPDGTSHLMGPPTGRPMAAIESGGTLCVSVEGGQNTPAKKYLKAPPAEGMSSDPVTVSMDPRNGFWMIQNTGRTNTLRVQQYGLSAVPLRPQTSMPMAGRDVAVWIPVVPHGSTSGKSESFRLLIVATGPEKQEGLGPTRLITAPRRYLSEAKQEALIAYFGDHLSWPPLPAPHVRQQAEVEKIANQHGLAKTPIPGALGPEPVRRAGRPGRTVQGRRLVPAARRSRPDPGQPPGRLPPPGGTPHDHAAARLRVGQ